MNEPGPTAKSPLAQPVAALLAAVLFWSSVPLLLKYFTRTLDAWTVNGLRYLFAALFWLPYVIRCRRAIPAAGPEAEQDARSGAGRNIWKDAAAPAACHVVGQMLFGLTPYYNDATVINFVSRISFLFTTLLGFSLLPDERPLARRPLFWAGFAGNVAGLAILYAGGAGTQSTSAFGMLLLTATAALWGLYSVLVRRFMSGYPVGLSFGVISLYAAPGLLALMFGVGEWREALHAGLGLWFLIWISAVAGIALGHTLFYRAIHALGPITSEGCLLLIPFATALFARPTLGEHLSPSQWTGGLVLILGCLALILAKARSGPAAHPYVAATTD